MTLSTLTRLLLAVGVLFLTVPTVDAGTTVDSRRVATGLIRPVFGTSPPGDLERLFIVEQRGVIRIFDLTTGTLMPGQFLNIDPLVSGGSSGGDETGFLGLAFHPNYDVNGYFYCYYYASGSQTRVRRYTVSADPNVADSSSGVDIISFSQPFSNHNGGTIAFSPVDGYLYVGLGDGGSANDPFNNAQNDSTLLGKMIRIDVDGGTPYAIPPDNPFVGVGGVLPEIWSKGLRNPYRWSFDRDTGDLWIGDVGQGSREEVDFEPAQEGGRNYGWRCREGTQCTGLSGCTCTSPTLTDPVHDYSHIPNHCSVIGGYVYRGCAIPDLEGVYFFADYCSNQIWSGRLNGAGTDLVEFTTRTSQLTPPPGQGAISQISGFGEDNYGEIYIFDLAGEMFKIVPTDLDSQDCNGNFIVDSCETGTVSMDCNGNGVDDVCDIFLGTSTDCNGNGIPDECDVDTGVLEDCDSSGVADLCEIQDGVALDCNSNGIPDSCDLVSGVLTDDNGDGYADECDYFILRAMDSAGGPGQTGVEQFIAGTTPDSFSGYSVGMSFDPVMLSASAVDLTGTVADGADFVAPNIDNVAGWITIGVVLDITPPIDTSLPAGVDQPLVRTLFEVDPGATDGDTSALVLEESIGDPAVQPVITVGSGFSEVPFLVSGTFTVGAVAGQFIRGDSNADGGFDIADPVNTLAFLFSGGAPLTCMDAGDANDDGGIDISDAVFSLSALFSGGASPSAPHPSCGIDPTADTLTCDSFAACP